MPKYLHASTAAVNSLRAALQLGNFADLHVGMLITKMRAKQASLDLLVERLSTLGVRACKNCGEIYILYSKSTQSYCGAWCKENKLR